MYTQIKDTVDDIRYQALLMIGKDEFSMETMWQEPKVVVILEQMFCPTCCMNVDLDVCGQKHPENEQEGWICWKWFV